MSLEDSGIWVNPCGSIHLAHREDEWAVLEEFAAVAPALGYDCRLLTPSEVAERTDFANPDGLFGGLFSPTELCVNPRKVIRELPVWLHERFGVRFEFGTTITEVDCGSGPAVRAAVAGTSIEPSSAAEPTSRPCSPTCSRRRT